MDIIFFLVFIGLTIVFIAASLPLYMKITNKIRSENYSAIETKVIAVKVKYGPIHGENGEWGVYEWEYNGKTHRLHANNAKDSSVSFANYISLSGSTLPDTLEITVNKMTGKFKRRTKQEKREGKLYGCSMGLFMVLAFILAVIITGRNPFFG